MNIENQSLQSESTTEHVANKIHQAVDRAASGLSHTEEKLRHEASCAAEKVREGAHIAQEKSADILKSVSCFVKENPIAAIGIAFVAGSIISSLSRRR
jgi:ElaB/YqjD/DUF883 family membrane-anchored ribosome-binding protein